jgi:hypothetical protein
VVVLGGYLVHTVILYYGFPLTAPTHYNVTLYEHCLPCAMPITQHAEVRHHEKPQVTTSRYSTIANISTRLPATNVESSPSAVYDGKSENKVSYFIATK